jgi:hypothetical protein
MNPEYNNDQLRPAQTAPQSPQDGPIPPKRRHKKLAFALLFGPTILLILSFLLYAVVNLITSPSQPVSNSELFSEPSLVTTVSNILLFVLGTIGILSWLPGIIIGIILLNKK